MVTASTSVRISLVIICLMDLMESSSKGSVVTRAPSQQLEMRAARLVQPWQLVHLVKMCSLCIDQMKSILEF